MTTKTRNREPITIERVGDLGYIRGDAYMQKEIIKSNGFRWNHEKKIWYGPWDNVPQLREQIMAQGVPVSSRHAQKGEAAELYEASTAKYEYPVTFTITYGSFSLQLPATPSDIERLYRQVMADMSPRRGRK